MIRPHPRSNWSCPLHFREEFTERAWFVNLQNPTNARTEAERLIFEWAKTRWPTASGFLKKVLFSDRAHFLVECIR